SRSMAERSPSMRGQAAVAGPGGGGGGAPAMRGRGASGARGRASALVGGSLTSSTSRKAAEGTASADSQLPQPHSRRPPRGTCTTRPQFWQVIAGIVSSFSRVAGIQDTWIPLYRKDGVAAKENDSPPPTGVDGRQSTD